MRDSSVLRQGRGGRHLARAFAEFERELIRDRVKSGLRNALRQGKTLGRPRKVVDVAKIATLRASGRSWRSVADEMGISERSLRRLALHCGENPLASDSAAVSRQRPIEPFPLQQNQVVLPSRHQITLAND
jgi:DNA invertase Pin-like site-specific DNA recombinase